MKNITVDYGFDQLTVIVVKVPELDYQRAIASLASEAVKETDVSSWGRSVIIHEVRDGVGGRTGWAEVTFTNRTPISRQPADPPA